MSIQCALPPRRSPRPALLPVVLTALAVAAALIAGIPPASAATSSAATSSPATSSAAIEVELTNLVGVERAAAGVGPLRVDVRLVAAGRGWSSRMADIGAIEHPAGGPTLPAGTSAWAENIGSASGPDATAALHEALMASPPHREHLLDPAYTELGIGVVVRDGTVWATQLFTAGAPAATDDAVLPIAAAAGELFAGGQARHAVIVRDDAFPDALAAGPLAGTDGPLLLTPPGPALHAGVRLALERALPRGATVYLVGGEAAVTPGVEAELRDAGWSPRRVSGEDRVETAAAVARTVAERDGPPSTVLVATSEDWPDATAGGAYGAATGSPVLLAHPDRVPEATQAFLTGSAPDQVVALGGSGVLGDGVVAAMDARRVAGPTREATAAAVAAQLWGRTTATDGDRWIVAPSTDTWQWALGAAPAAARDQAPVLLVGDTAPASVTDYLSGLGYGGGVTGTLDVVGPVDGAVAATLRDALD